MTQSIRDWLDAQRAVAPASLLAAMSGALDDVAGAGDASTTFARAAHACLDHALRIGDDRAAALHLLAADALLTAACELAAADNDALQTLAADFSAPALQARFAGRLARSAP